MSTTSICAQYFSNFTRKKQNFPSFEWLTIPDKVHFSLKTSVRVEYFSLNYTDGAERGEVLSGKM